jgi:polar amino acid transport system substrate-binding protein
MRFVLKSALLVLCGLSWQAQAANLQIVTEAWAPYVFEENGKPTGVDYEVMEAVLKRMGHTFNFEFCPWKRCIKMLEEGDADALLDMDKGNNNEREKFAAFPEENLNTSSSVLFFKKGTKFTYTGLDSLKDKTVGVSAGYVYNKEFDTATTFTREAATATEQNLTKLINNRINFAAINKNVGLYTAKKMGILDRIDYDPTPISDGTLFLGFSKKRGHDQLAQDFGKNLAAFKKTKEYKVILKKYGQ